MINYRLEFRIFESSAVNNYHVFFHSIVGIIEVDLNLNFHGFEIWLFGYLGLPGISVLLELDWTSGCIEGGGGQIA